MPDSFATRWIAVRQSPLSVGFSRHGFWSGLHFCVLGISGSLASPATGLRCEAERTQGTQLSRGSWLLRSLGSSWLRDQTHIFCRAGGFFTTEPPRQAQFLEWWLSCWSCQLLRLSCCSSLCAPFTESVVGKAWVGKLEENSRCRNCKWVYPLWAGTAVDTLYSLVVDPVDAAII